MLLRPSYSLRSNGVDADGNVQNPFRDSLVALNVTNNNMLAELAPVRKRTVRVRCADVRKDKNAREKIAGKTEAIVNDLGSDATYLGQWTSLTL